MLQHVTAPKTQLNVNYVHEQVNKKHCDFQCVNFIRKRFIVFNVVVNSITIMIITGDFCLLNLYE